MQHRETATLDPRERLVWSQPPSPRLLALGGGLALGAACVLAILTGDGMRRFWFAYLVNFSFLLSLSLGALFFVLLQHVTRAGWSVVVRRVAEVVACNLLLMAVLFLPILGVVAAGQGTLYPWAQSTAHGPADADATAEHGHAAHGDDTAAHGGGHGHGLDELTLAKRPYLNAPFFALRWAVYFAVWGGLALVCWRRSLRQDAEADPGLTLGLERLSAPGLVIFALTVTFAAFDLLMSLDAHWYSTIFGVYYFTGATVGFFALMILALQALQRRGLLAASVTVEHYHDLGKFLFAFVFFWGYIAFSQYMLIWYANIPEETGWLVRRGLALQAPNVWSVAILLLLVGHFLLPFGGLLSRHVKRHRTALAGWAGWLLLMHWVDVYWLIMPEYTTDHLPLAVELVCLAGMGLLFVAGLVVAASGRNLVPVRDPRLGESLALENV